MLCCYELHVLVFLVTWFLFHLIYPGPVALPVLGLVLFFFGL